MGGHGGSSGYQNGGGRRRRRRREGGEASFDISNKESKLSDVKNHKELQQYLDDGGYGIKLGYGTKSLPFDTLKQAVQGVTDTVDEFPEMKGLVREIKTSNATSYVAQASYTASMDNVTITLAKPLKKKADVANAIFESSNEKNFNHQNMNVSSVLAHETGHAIETYLTAKKYGGGWKAFQMRVARVLSTDVVTRAAQNLQSKGETKTLKELTRDVSKYATYNMSETLAECVGDVYANGSNAKPLSKEVWRMLKAGDY